MYQNDAKSILTPECRLSYAKLITPVTDENNPNAKPKYKVTLLIPKSTGIKAELDAAVEAAAQEAVNKAWGGVRPSVIDTTIYDGDGLTPKSHEPWGPECKGCWVVKTNTIFKPHVCHKDNVRCELAPQDVYSGMWARVLISFSGFKFSGSKGVCCNFSFVAKTRDDVKLEGKSVDLSAMEQSLGSAPAINPLTGLPY